MPRRQASAHHIVEERARPRVLQLSVRPSIPACAAQTRDGLRVRCRGEVHGQGALREEEAEHVQHGDSEQSGEQGRRFAESCSIPSAQHDLHFLLQGSAETTHCYMIHSTFISD